MSGFRTQDSGAQGSPEQATPSHEETRPSFAAGWDEPSDLSRGPASIPDPAETEVPAALKREIEALLARYPDRHSAALPALHAAQRVHGWCSPDAIDQVAAVMAVTPAYLSSITTFYDMFKTEPSGRHYVYVCTSVACMTRDARSVYEAIAAEGADLDDTEIREFECLGACDMAPMASIDGRFVGPLGTEDAPELVAAIREGREPLPGRGLEDMAESAPGRWEKSGPKGDGGDSGDPQGATS